VLALSPQTHKYLEERGADAAKGQKDLQTAARNALDTNYSIDQMLRAAAGAQLGPGADVRAWGEKWLSGLGQAVGAGSSDELTNYTELEKYANKIAFASARQMGAREAAQIVELQMESNPNKNMTPDAFRGVALSMKALNSYVIDKNMVLQAAGTKQPQAEAQWLRDVDPRVWSITLSPAMGAQWAEELGKEKIQSAFRFMSPTEKAALIRNIPPELRQKWLKPTS
jgi:hypothetical protein